MKKHNFEQLYQRKAKGKIYIWRITVIEHSASSVEIITEYGQLDGKLTTKSKKLTAGKAGRSVLEQAISEAQSDWNKKVNKGGYITNLKEAHTKVNVKPMLAHTFIFEEEKDDKKGYAMKLPCLGEPKYDGIRCIAHYEDGKVILKTRTGKDINNFEDIENRLEKIFKSIAESIYLDGELYTSDLPFDELNGLTRKISITEEDKKMINMVKYYIYDCFDLENIELKQLERKKFISEIIPKDDPKLKVVKYDILKTETDIRKKHEMLEKEGYEGIILRDPAGLYELNKRSRYLLKYKTVQDEEFKVVGFHVGQDEVPTVVWECETNMEVDGKKSIFSVKPEGTVENRAKMLKNAKNYIGKWLTVKYQTFTDKTHGIPRFPVGKAFRDKEEIVK